MSRSFINLRRALFGVSCAIVFGFGGTQALAAPARATMDYCSWYEREICMDYCVNLHGEGNAVGRCYRFGSPHYTCECVLM